MQWEAVEDRCWKDCRVSLYQRRLPDGRRRFLAETWFDEGDRVLLDHWNLSALRRMVQEILPIMEMARRLQLH
jgi:hypothetical protein